jgi:hypothetical protein
MHATSHRVQLLLTIMAVHDCRVLVFEHFASIIQSAIFPSLHVEKAIICLLLLCVKLIHKEEIRERILRALEIFLSLEPAVADAMSETIAVGLSKLLQCSSHCVRSVAGWKTIFTLLQRCASHPGARDRALNALRALIARDPAASRAFKTTSSSNLLTVSLPSTVSTVPTAILDKDTLMACFNALAAFASIPVGLRMSVDSTSSDTELSINAMRSMYVLYEMVPGIGMTTSVHNPIQSNPIQPNPILSCPVLSCPVLSCPVLSCPVLSCPVLSCPVLSCPVLSCPMAYTMAIVMLYST